MILLPFIDILLYKPKFKLTALFRISIAKVQAKVNWGFHRLVISLLADSLTFDYKHDRRDLDVGIFY